MTRIGLFILVGIVMIHGLIHLLGFMAYWPLIEIAELSYKTTLLGGRWDIGQVGMRLFSVLWLVAGIGLVGALIGIIFGRDWWLPVMGAAVLLSLVICLLDWDNAWRGAVLDLVALVPLLFVRGLQIQPEPFADYPQPSQPLTAVSLPTDLPDPVARYYQAIMPDRLPVLDSAVITGHGNLRFAGITFPTRLRFIHQAGQGYRHYIEATLFGFPLLRVNERYLNGQAWMELPVGLVENEPTINMAANLGLWGESIWLPSIYLTDARIRWQAIDDRSARLIVPFGEEEDTFTVFFDSETGLMTSMEAMRYREADDEGKIPWQLDVLAWDDYQGIRVPSRSTATWADENSPWLVIEIDDVIYNVDVSDTIVAEGQ
ncbi:MAG: DUF6544 family protein [Candidatus Promineifilaceae bacterium]